MGPGPMGPGLLFGPGPWGHYMGVSGPFFMPIIPIMPLSTAGGPPRPPMAGPRTESETQLALIPAQPEAPPLSPVLPLPADAGADRQENRPHKEKIGHTPEE